MSSLKHVGMGLDFGTSNSAVAWFDGEQLQRVRLQADGAILPTAIPSFSAVGKRLNPELERIPREIAPEIPEAVIRTSRWGLFFDEVMLNPDRYGIENTKDKCAGRAIFDEDTTPCAKPAAYYFYHQGHPSTAVHKAVGEKLYQEALSFPAK